MSLIGLLEQFKVSSVLGRIETHAKTGLLIIQQGGTWVEFYFRDGMLMCIGPVRTNAHLGERLLQDGLITPQALREAMQALASTPLSENRIALTLMDLGLVGLEQFRSWAQLKVLDVLQVIVTWTTGEVYFEDEVTPPPDRLLIALSVMSLLAQIPTEVAASPDPASPTGLMTQEVANMAPANLQPDVTQIPTLMNAAQFLAEQEEAVAAATPQPPRQTSQLLFADDPASPTFPAQSLIDPQAFTAPSQADQGDAMLSAASFIEDDAIPPQLASQPLFTNTTPLAPPMDKSGSEHEFSSSIFSAPADADAGSFSSIFASNQENGVSFTPPQPVMTPPPPRFVDTSYMRSDMLLTPLNLSSLRDRQPLVLLTPDQWRVLTRADGQTSLQTVCQELSMRPDMVCQVVGELIADQLIQLMLPNPDETHELSPTSREFVASGLSNGYVAPGAAATSAQPWTVPVPPSQPDAPSQFSSSSAFETQSQWGNGGNGASFIPGRGWTASPRPVSPLSPGTSSGPYVKVGNSRQQV